jgi:uncharacterized membrane protein
MNTLTSGSTPLEHLLAVFLRYGTWIACAMTGAGMALSTSPGAVGTRTLTAGVALFILLPVLRLLLMFVVFARQRNYRYAVIAAAVLAIVATGAVLGVRLGPLGG